MIEIRRVATFGMALSYHRLLACHVMNGWNHASKCHEPPILPQCHNRDVGAADGKGSRLSACARLHGQFKSSPMTGNCLVG